MSVWRNHDWRHSRPDQLASSHSSFEQPSSEHRHPIASSTRSFVDDIRRIRAVCKCWGTTSKLFHRRVGRSRTC